MLACRSGHTAAAGEEWDANNDGATTQGPAAWLRGGAVGVVDIAAHERRLQAPVNNPTSNLYFMDATMYSAATTTALGISGTMATTCTFSSTAFAVVSNTTLTNWNYTIVANHMRISARWSTTFANQTAVKPIIRMHNVASWPCYIHRGQSPLCAIDETTQVGADVTMPLPNTISSAFNVMDIDLTGKGWVFEPDRVYFLSFVTPVVPNGVDRFSYQLGRVTGFNRVLSYLTRSVTSSDCVNGGAEPNMGAFGVLQPDSTSGQVVYRIGYQVPATPSSTGTPTPTATGTGTATPSPSTAGSAPATGTGTGTPSQTGTASPTPSGTGTGTGTATGTGTGTSTSSGTGSGTSTPTGTGTIPPTPSQTGTSSSTTTPSPGMVGRLAAGTTPPNTTPALAGGIGGAAIGIMIAVAVACALKRSKRAEPSAPVQPNPPSTSTVIIALPPTGTFMISSPMAPGGGHAGPRATADA